MKAPISPTLPASLASLRCLKFWAAAVAFEQRLARELSLLGLTVSSFRLIGEVMGEPEGLRLGELARRLGVRPPTVSVAVDRLETRGVLLRRPDPEDPRARRVHIAQGASLRSGVEVLRRLEELMTRGMSRQDLSDLDRLLARMKRGLDPTDVGP
jgi:DNA-binding MarR family transcriptional regulator